MHQLKLIHSRQELTRSKSRMLRCGLSSDVCEKPLPTPRTVSPLEQLRQVRPGAAALIDEMIMDLLVRFR